MCGSLPAIEAGLEQVHGAWGDFDVLVSGAAGNFPASLNGMSANAFRSVVEIDLMGTVHVMKASHGYLKKPGASVINISAPQAFLPMPGQSHVSAAKAGVDMITRTLAIEWGGTGSASTPSCRGPSAGPKAWRGWRRPKTRLARSRPRCRWRLGTPDDIGHACMFLASEMGTYVSGAVLPVDGGWAQSGCGGMGMFLGKLVAQMEGR
jgi:NAD(P)-dependent dehydrogenase (short-subunit alcohol dehydrogenase family)